MDIWKPIPQYEGIYKVSNTGKVKSLKRKGCKSDRILKLGVSKIGYYVVVLCKDKIHKSFNVHQLVAMAFLNHKPDKFKAVINHKNFNKLDNHVRNIEIVSNRENCNKKHFKNTSKYVGVSWYNITCRWRSGINYNGKNKHLGYFINEYEAHLAYQKALNNL